MHSRAILEVHRRHYSEESGGMTSNDKSDYLSEPFPAGVTESDMHSWLVQRSRSSHTSIICTLVYNDGDDCTEDDGVTDERHSRPCTLLLVGGTRNRNRSAVHPWDCMSYKDKSSVLNDIFYLYFYSCYDYYYTEIYE